MRHSISEKISLILFMIAAVGFQVEGRSQTAELKFQVEGMVKNSKGGKAIGAAVMVKGTTIGTATDTMGYFSLKVPSDQSVLVISHFSTPTRMEVPLDGSSKITVSLGEKGELDPSLVPNTISVLDQVDELPVPVVGMESWNQYISKNISYPQSDRDSGIEGTVVVGFEIDKDGKMQNVEVLRGIGGECDKEATKIISSGPAWIPGKLNGESVTTRMRLPILFRLSSDLPVNYLKQQKEKAIAEEFGEYFVVVGYPSVSPAK